MKLVQQCDLVLVAGGTGSRVGSQIPKQFLEINGRPLYLWSLDIFLCWPMTGHIVAVVPNEWVSPLKESFKILDSFKNIQVVEGGTSRQKSAELGLKALGSVSANRWVMIHDAARPALTTDLLDSVWEAGGQGTIGLDIGGVIPAVRAHDTVKRVELNDGVRYVDKTLSREHLYLVQTPQLIRRDVLEKAYLKFSQDEAADDASLIEKMGLKVIIIDGERQNIKVTFEEDIERVSHWLRKRHPPF